MGRIFILAIVANTLATTLLGAQNLLYNGSFEEVHDTPNNTPIRVDDFYATGWFVPTRCTVNLFRDTSACSEEFIQDMDINYCIPTLDSSYCIGFYVMNYHGYMEHVTGSLIAPLVKGQTYKISFYTRFFGAEPYFGTGWGYKLTTDSIPFPGGNNKAGELKPFYLDLFAEQPVYGDFAFTAPVVDAVHWKKYTTFYTATGGERFITFGQFALPSKLDKKIRQQIRKLYQTEVQQFEQMKRSNELAYLFYDSTRHHYQHQLGGNYYLLDQVKVEPLTTTEQQKSERMCETCVDLDPLTVHIPAEREFHIDRGFVGDLTLQLGVRLKPMQKYVLTYGKELVTMVCTGTSPQEEAYAMYDYTLTYPARKLRKRPIRFYVAPTTWEDIDLLKQNSDTVQEVKNNNFIIKIFK